MPFDFTEVIAAIAPRAVFIVAPLGDDNFAVEGVRDVRRCRSTDLCALGPPQRLRVVYPDCGHDFPKSARDAAYAFLAESLSPAR